MGSMLIIPPLFGMAGLLASSVANLASIVDRTVFKSVAATIISFSFFHILDLPTFVILLQLVLEIQQLYLV